MSASFIISVCLVCFSLISASCLGIKANCSLNDNVNNFKSAPSISCFDFGKSLTELERHAKVIITGTVEKLIPSINDIDTLSAIVRIRRVFKGQEYLKIKNDSTTSEIHRAINVSGLYDFTICESIVKEKDTKIFFLNKIADGSYRISSSLLTINLKNLDSVEAAVKGRKQFERLPLKQELCENIMCNYGATCKVNETTRETFCGCFEQCSDVFAPVCGNDNVTYNNDCFMRMASCRSQRRIRIQNRFACDSKDPCAGIHCQYGASCVVSADGKLGYCKCPDKCYQYGDSRGSRPVCGDDGVDYESLCHLTKESCKQVKPTKVKYTGRCDPCASVTCPENTICKLNTQREPICRCSEQCPLDFHPVCASDGNTYRNLCIMTVQACKRKTELRVFADVSCEKTNNPCKNLKCDYGQQCYIDLFNQSSCQCLHTCEPVMRPVCGKDGVTYENECELSRSSCKKKERNSVLHRGPCGSGICFNYECSRGAVCLVENNEPRCQCPSCNEDLDPVCASNGITYANECKMRQEACQMEKDIFIKYRGFCDGCQSKACDYYSICVSDGRGSGECKCPSNEDCQKTAHHVCGTDGLTYDNECQLKVASCRKRMFVMVAAKGYCDSCRSVQCPWGGRCDNGHCVCPSLCPHPSDQDIVCGSDGFLYQSECYMQRAACIKGMQVKVVSRDQCPEEVSQMEPDEADDCECNRIGAYTAICDATGQCQCRPGVGGKKCDHCMSGFWGIHLIPKGHVGCIPCGCSAFGSMRDDCEQTTGRCVCKQAVSGMKCDACSASNHVLQPSGCVGLKSLQKPPKFCNETTCYFSAKCQMIKNEPQCVCPEQCNLVNSIYTGEMATMKVCGSDGVTYSSVCQLQSLACKMQKDVVVVSLGTCNATAGITYLDLGTTKTLKTTRHLTEEIGRKPDSDIVENEPNEITIQPPLSSSSESVGGLNQICISDTDCKIKNSVCVPVGDQTVCLCRAGYNPSVNRDTCEEFKPNARETNLLYNSCNSKPCLNNGTCTLDEKNLMHFKCSCHNGYSGSKCEIRSEKLHLYVLPHFNGDAFMQFNPIDAFGLIVIEIELKPEEVEGLILFSGHTDIVKGDFISVALIGGYVEFRYDLGDGVVILKSRTPLKMNQYHKIICKQSGQNASLSVDDNTEVYTPPLQGNSKNLNLNGKMYLGKVPKSPIHVIQLVGTKYSFIGCVKSLRINAKIFDLREKISTDVIKSSGIGECEVNPCSSMPCLNGGTCETATELDYRCICKNGFSGAFCEVTVDACKSYPCYYGSTCLPSGTSFVCICAIGKTGQYCDKVRRRGRKKLRRYSRSALDSDYTINEEIITPEFHGQSFLELRQLPSEVERTLSMEVWLKPYERDGLIFFAGYLNELHGYKGGDFVALALVNGKVRFTYDLGAGLANITSPIPLTMMKWYSIKASRNFRNGTLQIDHQAPIMGQSPLPWDKLNLNSYPLYIGGLRNNKLLPQAVGASQGLVGAVQRLVINGQVMDNLTKSAVLTSAVGVYVGPPCNPNPCKNKGVCLPKLGRYDCQCPKEFAGKNCDKENVLSDNGSSKPLFFNGQTMLKYRNRVSLSVFGRSESSYFLKLKTNASDGLILWENKGVTLKEDYLAIAISAGKVVVSFNLGKEQSLLEMKSHVPVSNGQWVTIRMWRTKRQAFLSVNNEDPITLISSPGATELNGDGFLWLGGTSNLPSGLPKSYSVGFIGCISEVKLDKQELHLTRDCLTPQKYFTFCEQ